MLPPCLPPQQRLLPEHCVWLPKSHKELLVPFGEASEAVPILLPIMVLSSCLDTCLLAALMRLPFLTEMLVQFFITLHPIYVSSTYIEGICLAYTLVLSV